MTLWLAYAVLAGFALWLVLSIPWQITATFGVAAAILWALAVVIDHHVK